MTIYHQVLSFDVKSASNRIDSFASPIFRAVISVWSKKSPQTNYSFVLKVPSTARPIKEDISFENEIKIYSSTLDEMHRLLNHAGENTQLGPRQNSLSYVYCNNMFNIVQGDLLYSRIECCNCVGRFGGKIVCRSGYVFEFR